jgi:hypothetical protein
MAHDPRLSREHSRGDSKTQKRKMALRSVPNAIGFAGPKSGLGDDAGSGFRAHQTLNPETGRLLPGQAASQLDVDLGASDRLQLDSERVDHLMLTHIGQRTLSAAPRHRLALCPPVASRPATHGRHFGIVGARLPVHLDG